MHWAELGSGRTANLAAHISSLSSGATWSGFSVEEVQGPPAGELPEGYFLHHVLLLHTTARPATQRRVASSSWQSVPTHSMAVEFCPAGVPWALRWQRPTAAITMDIAPAFISKVLGPGKLDESRLQFWSSYEEPLLTHLLLALADDARAGFPNGRVYGESLGAAVVAELARKSAAAHASLSLGKGGLTAKTLRNVLERIDANLDGDLSVQGMAALAEMTTDAFIRAFKQSTGASPHQYVLRQRVDRAQALLGNLRLSLAEIALRSGFADQSHFSRTFHRMVGLPPRQYRNALR